MRGVQLSTNQSTEQLNLRQDPVWCIQPSAELKFLGDEERRERRVIQLEQ
jgi:hypothetical protein